jgi:hypothetical protein
MKTLRDAAQAALDVQNACNLSGILLSWGRAASIVRETIGNNCRAEYLRHAINVLFASKVSSLMVVATDCIGGVYGEATVEGKDLFRAAYEECDRLSRTPVDQGIAEAYSAGSEARDI